MEEAKPIQPFINVENIPLEQPSSQMSFQGMKELQGEIRLGQAVRRLIVLDENGIPVMVIGQEKNGF